MGVAEGLADEASALTPRVEPTLLWLTVDRKLDKTKTKTANEKVAATDLDRPLRITGQMMMDGSHTPCHNSSGSSK